MTSRLIGPLQLVLHVVQKRRAGEPGTHALGQDKQRSRIIKNVHFLCLSSPSACLALQHGSFVPREWPIVLVETQPRTQACSRYPSDQRRLGTERDRRIFPTSLTGDVTSEIAEDDWERGW